MAWQEWRSKTEPERYGKAEVEAALGAGGAGVCKARSGPACKARSGQTDSDKWILQLYGLRIGGPAGGIHPNWIPKYLGPPPKSDNRSLILGLRLETPLIRRFSSLIN
jgi:hypothetical protein